MRCERCVRANTPHTVVEEDRTHVGTGRSQRSWDAEDREHRHDPRWDLVHLRCSSGHAFKAIERVGAVCGAKGCVFEASLSAQITKAIVQRWPGENMPPSL